MRAALYVRVSTDEQAKSGYSIPDQLRELHRHADSNGYRVVDTLIDDGYSGADPTRPGMMKAMELAESGVIDVVLAKKRDRLFRSRLQWLLMDRSLGEYSVKLVATNDTSHRIGDGVQDAGVILRCGRVRPRWLAGSVRRSPPRSWSRAPCPGRHRDHSGLHHSSNWARRTPVARLP